LNNTARDTRVSLTGEGFWAAIAAALLVLWALTAPGLFTVDEFFYQQMASGMASDGRLSFAQMRLDNVASVDMVFAFPAEGGRLTPQYPSGYAIIAAPFYAALGVKGLMLVNTLAALFVCIFVHKITRRLGANEDYARAAVLIFFLCTFASTYFSAVWPHMISAAIATAIVYLAIAGAQDARMRFVIAAGLLTGIGCAIRIDTIVLTPAVFLWARLDGVDRSRRYLAYFLGGLAAGLMAPAGLNYLKFGTLNPFTYQNAMPQNDPALFLGPAAVIAAVLTLVFFVDFVRLLRPATAPGRNAVMIASIVAGLILAALISDRVRILLGGYYTFLVDQQAFAFADRLSGVARNEFGILIFFGVLKKALLQSAPFAAIVALPLFRLLRGRLISGARLLLFVCAGYVTLYALNQTDAGLALSQRFLVPVLPFVSILSALELSKLAAARPVPLRLQGYALAAGLVVMAGLLVANLSPSGLTYHWVLYAPLFIAFAVAGLALAWEFQETRVAAFRASLALYFAFGASAASAAGDEIWTAHYRSIARAKAEGLSAATPSGALVLTDRIIFWSDRASRDVSLAYWSEEHQAQLIAGINPFLAAGRMVYAHGVRVADGLRQAGCAVEEIPAAEPVLGLDLQKITGCGPSPATDRELP
jgi:hypothetical protein